MSLPKTELSSKENEHTTNTSSEEKLISSNSSELKEPSHIMSGQYAALMETNGKECESWYYFIRYENNIDALNFLQQQLEQVDWYILDDLSTFDLDLDHLIDAKTAKDMSKLELNSYAFHRKFDGKLSEIHFNFTKKDLKNNDRMMEKVFDLLGYGQIEDYVSDEDLDPEDYKTHTETDSDDTDNDSDSSLSDHSPQQNVKHKVPASLLATEPPRWVKKRKNKKH